jgi:hypothetical protein
MNDIKLIDEAKAAAMLGISLADINQLATRRQIPHYRIKRKILFDIRDIEQFLKDSRIERREVKND